MDKPFFASARKFIATAFCLAVLAGSAALSFSAPPEGTDLEIGGSGAEPGKFADLRDMVFDSQDNLFTLEGPSETKDRDNKYPGNARVQKFDNTGKFLTQFSIRDEALDATGKKDGPTHLAVDARGHVFVTFPQANLVREFGPDGAKLRDFTVPGANGITACQGAIAVTGGTPQIVKGKWASGGGDAVTLIKGDKTETITLTAPVAKVEDMTADQAGNFYILAELNTVFKFAPDGKLLKTLGAQTKTNAEDGSELKHSVAVDSKGNVYAMANNFLTRFAPDFQTVTQREVKYKWFENAGWKMLAIDSRDRMWAATPDLVTHSLFERHHFRPVIVRVEPTYYEPQERGVRVASALSLGLKASIEPGLPFGVAYDLKEFPGELVIAPANRNVPKLSVEYRVFDAYRKPAGGSKFDLALKDGKEARAPMNFTPPRFGWYTFDVIISANGQELFRIGKHVGVTPDFPGMVKLEKAEGMGTTNDAPKQMFVGLPNMRLNAGADPKSLDTLEKTLATAQKYGAVPFVAFTDEKDITESSVRAAVTRFKGRVKVWEIINEPNLRMTPEKYVNDYLKLASTIIHEVDPEAKVMGPAGCGVQLPWYEGFYKAGGGPLVDILSLHDYEGHETIDPVHWRWKIGELRKIMDAHGDGAKEIWQTERVISGVRGGVFMPMAQAANMAQHRDLLETLGISPDHNNHYYVNAMGYTTVPSYIWGNSGPHPAALVTRTRYAQTLGQMFTGDLGFGPQGNEMVSGLRYHGPDGQTIVLRNEGTADQKLIFGIKRGGATVKVVDAWGNASDLPVRDGKVELTLTSLPTYLHLAPGLGLDRPIIDFGRNLAERATFTYSGHTERPMSLLNNGIVEVIHAGNPNGGTDGGKIWTGDLPQIDGKIVPQTLDIDFGKPRVFDKIMLHGLRADNQFCTLLDYDLQAETDGTWKTLVEARSTVPPSDPVSTPPNFAMQWSANEHLMVHELAAPVTASRLRLIARRATWGYPFDTVATQATRKTFGGTSKMKLMLREVEVFGPSETMAITATVEQPQKTAVFPPKFAMFTVGNMERKTFSGTAKLSAPAGWTVLPAEYPLNIEPNANQPALVRVTPPATLPIGAAFIDIEVQDATGKTLESAWLRYDIASPLEFLPGAAKNIGSPAQALSATVKNITAAPLFGSAKLEVAGQTLEQPFGPVEPGKTADLSFPVPALKLAGSLLTANYTVTANHLQITATQPLGVREWNVIGTWEKDMETAFGPEKEAGRVDTTKNFTDAMGQEQKWQTFASNPNGYLDLLPLQPHENVTAYALIYVNSPAARRAVFSVGTDDGGKAWLNGQEVFTDPAAHDSAPGQVQKPVELKAGRNEVLFKIVQGKFKMGLHFDLLDESARPMMDLSFSAQP